MVKMLTNNPPKLKSSHVNVILDGGNSLWKLMLLETRNTITYPHALKHLTSESKDKVLQRRKRGVQRGSGSDMFEYKGQFVMVGERAEIEGGDTRAGGPKYQSDYYPFLFLKGLLELLPDGHNDIRVMAMYPPSDDRHVDTLMDSLGGRHVVKTLDGKTITYRVREVYVCDEPVGGLRNWMMADDGIRYRISKPPRGVGLCVDVGGKISSLVPFDSSGFVDYPRAVSIDYGIQNIMSVVSDKIMTEPDWSALFSSYRGSKLPFDSNMRQALQSGVYYASGYELNVYDIVAESAEFVLSKLRDTYEGPMGGARPYSYIIVTGGGGGLLYRPIVEQVLNFNPERVWLSHDDPEEYHLANLFGAAKTMKLLLKELQ